MSPAARSDADERLDDARGTVALLFPGSQLRPRDRHQDRDVARARTFTIAPSIRHPRLLIPRFPGNAADIVLRSYGGRLSTRGRRGYQGFRGLLRATGGRTIGKGFVAASPDGSRARGIDDHLATVLGEQVAVAMQLSPARANRKPVLHALVADRPTQAAFVKVGTNSLTSRLADQEATALRRIAAGAINSFTVPAVIDHSKFAGLSVLVLSPLPTWQRGRLPDADEVAAAAAAVARLDSPWAGPLSDADLWHRLDVDLRELPATEVSTRLRQAYVALEDSATGIDIETGASHGDWSPWNMWKTDDQFLIWDWERFSTGVPLGSDLIHYRLQQQLVDRAELVTAARMVVDQSPSILRSCVTDPSAARLTALVHLLALAVRYQGDRQADFGAVGGRTQDWLLPVIEASLADSLHRPRNI
jgi:hypothetical protein